MNHVVTHACRDNHHVNLHQLATLTRSIDLEPDDSDITRPTPGAEYRRSLDDIEVLSVPPPNEEFLRNTMHNPS